MQNTHTHTHTRTHIHTQLQRGAVAKCMQQHADALNNK